MLSKIKARVAAFLATTAGRITQRVVVAFAVTAAASLVSSGVFTMQGIVDADLWMKAGDAGVAAALALIQSVVSAVLTGGDPTVTATARLIVSRQARAERKERARARKHYRQLEAR